MVIMRLMVNTCLTYSEKYTGYRKNENVFVCYSIMKKFYYFSREEKPELWNFRDSEESRKFVNILYFDVIIAVPA